MTRPAIAILSAGNLIHNLDVIKTKVDPVKIVAMVKANAYGHGIRSVASKLDKYADIFGVASIDEAMALRKIGVKAPILLTEGVFDRSELLLAATEGFHVVFHSGVQVDMLKKVFLPAPIFAWLKVNTGMCRLGVAVDEAKKYYEVLSEHHNIAKPIKVMSHFACASDLDHPLNQEQLLTFQALQHVLKEAEWSICNSAGLLHFSNCHYDYVRPGIMLYGASPIPGVDASSLGLKPVMTVQTAIISIQMLKKGSTIGYGARYKCPEDMMVGIIAFGYGDGYPGAAKDGTPILINGIECSVVGAVSMDMIAVDLRRCNGNCSIGDPAILWGEGLPVERIAAYTSSTVWEILTGVQNRVKFLWSHT
ncbi:alanine racemase [Rickettsiales endosymbiont of Peranema trichophorum]|uniref:alanine racemase n=1 Tax=Rickettsiales endosymbiont of Peranema trichophorum TaxID=2486577 RepID=UPI0010231B78|nr:alanine racemase [Rickettsiales endosymbiont of Peranema trichophorum]RZI46329.1 alanine racemase [Rickettsiales endosymbiont of Peranema trichophorum]